MQERTRERRSPDRAAGKQGRRSARSGVPGGDRTVIDLEERLAALDRDLDHAIGNRPGGELSEELAAALEGLGRVIDAVGLRDVIERLDRIRGSERADDFGFDPDFEEMIAPLFFFLYRRWWRVTVEGIDHVPATGGALLVANHSGAMFPYDGAMMKVALRLEHRAARELRPLVDNFVFQLPFVGSFMMRLGGVRACPENAETLLQRGEVVAVFPEGVRGMAKSFTERYHLQRFGRGGFVTLCLHTGSPIVPVAVVGAEEIHPLIGKWEWPAKLLGLPYLPVTPTFPWLGLLGLVPLPTKWTIRFGEAIEIGGRYRPEDATDELLVDRLAAEVQDRVQAMLEETLRARRSVFF